MNTARDIISYAEKHDIYISTREGQLILNAPKEELTDEFLESAKAHKVELLETLSQPGKLIEAVCRHPQRCGGMVVMRAWEMTPENPGASMGWGEV